MKNKKGQITIFIIIGIIIISAITIVYFARGQVSRNNNVATEGIQTAPIQTYVEECVKSVGEDAILHIGRHGGYFELPELSTDDIFYKTAYYFYIDKDIMPSQQTVEQELSKYINEEIYFCLRNFADFPGTSIAADPYKINTSSIISDNSILFKVNMPVTITSGETIITLDSFSANIEKVRLKTVYDISKAITDEQMKKFGSICINCILNWSIENDVYINIQMISNDTMLFKIKDNSSKLDTPLEYVFANKYNVSGNPT